MLHAAAIHFHFCVPFCYTNMYKTLIIHYWLTFGWFPVWLLQTVLPWVFHEAPAHAQVEEFFEGIPWGVELLGSTDIPYDAQVFSKVIMPIHTPTTSVQIRARGLLQPQQQLC